MMLKYRTNCKVCQLCKENPAFLKRLYSSKYFIPHSKDSLLGIQQEIKRTDPDHAFSYNALTNHLKVHQHLNAADYDRKMMLLKAKRAEVEIIKDRFEAQSVQDAIINIGMDALENGEIEVTADHLLRASKQKQDAQAKGRDQQLKLMEMVAFFTSGEDANRRSERIYDRRNISLEEYDPAVPVTEYSDSGPD